MKTFKKHLQKRLEDPNFSTLYEEERFLAELSLKINELREEMGLSQAELAHKAQITQQQLSKIENGINCNMTTFLKVCHALGFSVELKPSEVEVQASQQTKRQITSR